MQPQERSKRFSRVLKFSDRRLRLRQQQLDSRLGTVRLDESPLRLLQRTVELLLMVERFRQRVMRIPAVWIDLCGLLERRDGKIRAIFVDEGHAERTQNSGVLRVDLRC